MNGDDVLRQADAIASESFAREMHEELLTALDAVEWVYWQANAVKGLCVACGVRLPDRYRLTCRRKECRGEFLAVTVEGKLALLELSRLAGLLDGAGVTQENSDVPRAEVAPGSWPPRVSLTAWVLITMAAATLVYALGR